MGVLESWWELGGWAMAEFYRELRERPGLQFDLCFMGTRLIESRIVLELHAASVPHTDL